MSGKENFDITKCYGTDWEKIDWAKVEKSQLGMGGGESVVYHNTQEILKVFNFGYKHAEKIFPYEPALEAYKKRHTFWSKKPIQINARDVVWGDLIVRQYNNAAVRESTIENIIIKTLSLNESLTEPYPNEGVTVLKNIPYIDGASLQSMCHGPYEGKGKVLHDTKDIRKVKVGPKEVYRIGYSITDAVNSYVHQRYGIYCGEIVILFMICHTGLVPKNMKLTDIDLDSKTLTFTITDRCSDIMFWYISNHKNALFQNFISNNTLIPQKSSLGIIYKNIKDRIQHQIDRSYEHKR